MIQYKYIPLVGANLISRRHNRDVAPPGMRKLDNIFVSKSDNAITLRPNLNKTNENILAISDNIVFGGTDNQDDYLNSVHGLWGSDGVCWFTRFIPYGPVSGTLALASDTYTTGTVSGSAGSTQITGSGTSWLQNAWRGALIQFNGDGKYYIISGIGSDTLLTLTAPLEDSYSGDTYAIYYNHSPLRGTYRHNVQTYTSGLIYCSPDIVPPISAEDICGPFYAPIDESSWGYSGDFYSSDYWGYASPGLLAATFSNQDTFASNGTVTLFTHQYNDSSTALGWRATTINQDEAFTATGLTIHALAVEFWNWSGYEETAGLPSNIDYNPFTALASPEVDSDMLSIDGYDIGTEKGFSRTFIYDIPANSWRYVGFYLGSALYVGTHRFETLIGVSTTGWWNEEFRIENDTLPDDTNIYSKIYVGTDAILTINQTVGGSDTEILRVTNPGTFDGATPHGWILFQCEVDLSANTIKVRVVNLSNGDDTGWNSATLSTVSETLDNILIKSINEDGDDPSLAQVWQGNSSTDWPDGVKINQDLASAYSLTHNGTVFLAAGEANGQTSAQKRPAIAYSTTGLNTDWQVMPDVDLLEDDSFRSVAHSGSKYVAVGVADAGGVLVRKSDDAVTWATPTGDLPAIAQSSTKVRYLNSGFVIVGGAAATIWYGDGDSFTANTNPTYEQRDIIWDGSKYVAVNIPGSAHEISYATTISGTWTNVSLGLDSNGGPFHIYYDEKSDRVIVAGKTSPYNDIVQIYFSEDSGATWVTVPLSNYGSLKPPTTETTDLYNYTANYGGSNIVTIGDSLAMMWHDSKDQYSLGTADERSIRHIVFGLDYETTWSIDLFTPLSILYRSTSFTVLDGYVMLLGTREWNAGTSSWDYHPRRIRWTSPGTYNDFASTGSGTADLMGSGSILDGRAVNGRIVTFETAAIGSISPRGDTTDPWEYDIIKENIRSISNPVVVEDLCYFVDDQGLLRTTNGITVNSPEFSFDLTEYDDYNADIPIQVSYAADIESLEIYNPNGDDQVVYVVDIKDGNVSSYSLNDIYNGGTQLSPKSVICVDAASDKRMLVSHNPAADNTDVISLGELSTGDNVTGIDNVTDVIADKSYWFADIRSGEIYIVPDGGKTSVKHIILKTYANGTINPDVIIQVQSIEDTEWHDRGDTTGTATMTTTACTGVGTAWSNTIANGDDASTEFDLPWQASQCRLYIDSTLQVLGTDYTITDTKQITLTNVLATGEVLYAYSENSPEVIVSDGDYFESTEGFHRISSIETATSLTLDRYLSTGSETVTHHPAATIENGDGEAKLGINSLLEGARIRIIVIPRINGNATVCKITGIEIGHIPYGRKIVEATGD